MKQREQYLKQLISFRDKSVVKVITGVRRCGKSSLLDLFEQHLLDSGVPAASIIRMNFESLDFDEVKNYRQLHEAVKTRLQPNGTNYILLDEVQQVDQWEKAVNSLRLLKNIDLYITGSNAWLLASELSTLLSGRYVEIKMLPLSFKEYLDFNDYAAQGDVLPYFNQYLEFGGFPGVTELRDHPTSIRPLINGIYNTIIMKDVVQRNAVRDPALLESAVRFLCGNVGKTVSTKRVSDYLTSAGRKTSSDTIDNYLKMLESAFIFYRARRYDLKGKLHLKTQEKFYIVDIGIRNDLIGFRGDDYGFTLENIVYFELLRRGYEVSIGKLGALEVDFVATKPDKIAYYQVTASMLDESVRERELAPLRGISDNYEKVILSMDKTPVTDFEGIRNVNLLDFLLSGEA
jgi:predicted AAA+ superfamily ATPase